MIKSLRIKDLFEEKDVSYEMNSANKIIIGDNGSGKTTLLNVIYNSLIGRLDAISGIDFSYIELVLDEVKDIEKVEVYKSNLKGDNKNSLVMLISLKNSNPQIICYKSGRYSTWGYGEIAADYDSAQLELDLDFGANISSDMPEIIYQGRKLKVNYNFGYDELEEVLKFIGDKYIQYIKNNIIYFPTYRKIDDDLQDIIKVDEQMKRFDRFLYNRIDNFPEDRRVVGISEKNLDKLILEYSNKVKKISAEGINKLLREFVERTIKLTYGKKPQNEDFLTDTKEIENKKSSLTRLSKKLDFQIDREEIAQYYQRKISRYQQVHKLLNKNTNLNSEMRTTLNLVASIDFNNDEMINELIRLYTNYSKVVEKELEKYKYLNNAFSNFFGDKLKFILDSNTYDMSLSKNFSSLSTGQKQLICILAYTTLAFKDICQKPLIIIDEPEISLHIAWQRKLWPELSKHNDKQFIIATHSPFFIGKFNNQQVIQFGDIGELNG